MGYPENGLYMARVTDDNVRTFYADEDTVCDAQTVKMFNDRDQSRADQEQAEADKHRQAEEFARFTTRQAAKRKRRFLYMIKDVLMLIGTATLVYLTNRFGLYVAIAAVTGCAVAAVCRITNYFQKER